MANLVGTSAGLSSFFTYTTQETLIYESLHKIIVPFPFYFNGVDYGNDANGGIWFCTANYITFGTPYVGGTYLGVDYGAGFFDPDDQADYTLIDKGILIDANELIVHQVSGGVDGANYRVYLDGWVNVPTDWVNTPPIERYQDIIFRPNNSITILTDSFLATPDGSSGILIGGTLTPQATIEFPGTVNLTTANNGVAWTSNVEPKQFPDIEIVNRNYVVGDKIVGNNTKSTTIGDITEFSVNLGVTNSSGFEVFFTNSDSVNQVQIATLANALNTEFETVHITANNTTTNTLTIRRGREGSIPKPFATGSSIFTGATAALLDNGGKRVLNSGNFFIDKNGSAIPANWSSGNDVALSIGTGGDFASLPEAARFLNSSVIYSWNNIYIYFLAEGVYTTPESLNVLFSNKDGFPNIYITGGADPLNVTANPISYSVTEVTAVNSGTNTMTLTVADTTGLYVGGIFAIYPPTGSVPVGLTNKFSLMGANEILTVDSPTSVTVRYTYNSAVGHPTVVTGLTGITAKCNRITLKNTPINVSGNLGNISNSGGGFRSISFLNSPVIVDNGNLLLDNYCYFNTSNIKLVNSAHIETWGDVMCTNTDITNTNSSYRGNSPHYFNKSKFTNEFSSLYVSLYLQENDISTAVVNTVAGCSAFLKSLKTGTNAGALTIPTQIANNYLGYAR